MKWKQEEVEAGCDAAAEECTAGEPDQDQAETCTEIETSTETGMSTEIEMSTGILTEMSM